MHLGSTLCKILCIQCSVLRYYVIIHASSLVPRLFPHDKSLGTRLACTWFAKSCVSNVATVLRTEIGPINCHKSGSYSNF